MWVCKLEKDKDKRQRGRTQVQNINEEFTELARNGTRSRASDRGLCPEMWGLAGRLASETLKWLYWTPAHLRHYERWRDNSQRGLGVWWKGEGGWLGGTRTNQSFKQRRATVKQRGLSIRLGWWGRWAGKDRRVCCEDPVKINFNASWNIIISLF